MREDPCAAFEAPFMYLLIGAKQALLIDTGAVADVKHVPLAKTVLGLLPRQAEGTMPLLVMHTHGHQDHRLGDAQFANLPNVRVVSTELGELWKTLGFEAWPDDRKVVDLGDRVVDVVPAPGNHPAHVVFYDRQTALLFSGDFLMPGRLLVDDTDAYRASARRVSGFLASAPVSAVLGSHIEFAADGSLYSYGSDYHPNERALPLSKADLDALPAAMSEFNGFYSSIGQFTISNPSHNLMAGAAFIGFVLSALGFWWYHRRQLRKAELLE
jgi:glyoxylase-like metal-dependent hydrolase (beta-lactamase superfamily II)